MTGRPESLSGALQGGAQQRDTGGSPEFDPIWGTLGAPSSERDGGWPGWSDEHAFGALIDVEILGDHLHLTGQLHTGNFDRLSGWLNVQSGFVQVRNGVHIPPGEPDPPDSEGSSASLWIRLSHVVVVGDRSAIQHIRPGAPIIQKERRRVSIVTGGYHLLGDMHLHAHGSMAQFLDAHDPRFLPITELTVHGLADPTLVARFAYAMVNREQVITVLEEPQSPTGELAVREVRIA